MRLFAALIGVSAAPAYFLTAPFYRATSPSKRGDFPLLSDESQDSNRLIIRIFYSSRGSRKSPGYQTAGLSEELLPGVGVMCQPFGEAFVCLSLAADETPLPRAGIKKKRRLFVGASGG